MHRERKKGRVVKAARLVGKAENIGDSTRGNENRTNDKREVEKSTLERRMHNVERAESRRKPLFIAFFPPVAKATRRKGRNFKRCFVVLLLADTTARSSTSSPSPTPRTPR
jgi:hypothetical protein